MLLPDSGVLIDTPGVKLFGVTNDNTDNLSEILDISDYEGKCRDIKAKQLSYTILKACIIHIIRKSSAPLKQLFLSR